MAAIEMDPKKIKEKNKTEIIGEFSVDEINGTSDISPEELATNNEVLGNMEKDDIKQEAANVQEAVEQAVGENIEKTAEQENEEKTTENAEKAAEQEADEKKTENAEKTEDSSVTETTELEEKKEEFLELCAAAVISIDENQQVIVYNQALRPHSANKDASERLHITQTNAFVDAKDIQDLHTIAQQASLNGIDPFSSAFALKEMFERAVEEGLIPIEEAPDLNKNIIIGNIVYFKNGAIEELNLEIITLEVGQIESILEAENPEQLKEMLNEIENLRPKDARPPMDGPTQEATGRHAQDMGKDDVGMGIGTR